MKKIKLTFLSLFLGFISSAQVNWVPAANNDNTLWGYKNGDGKWMIKAKYKSCSEFNEYDHAVAKVFDKQSSSEKFALISSSGEYYSALFVSSNMAVDAASVAYSDYIKALTISLATIYIKGTSTVVETVDMDNLRNTYLSKTNQYDFITTVYYQDRSANITLPKNCYVTSTIDVGEWQPKFYNICQVMDGTTRYGVIDKDGKVIINPVSESNIYWLDRFNLGIIKQGGKYGIINTAQQITTPCEMDSIYRGFDGDVGFTWFKKDGKYGYLAINNGTSSIAFENKLDGASDFYKGDDVYSHDSKATGILNGQPVKLKGQYGRISIEDQNEVVKPTTVDSISKSLAAIIEQMKTGHYKDFTFLEKNLEKKDQGSNDISYTSKVEVDGGQYTYIFSNDNFLELRCIWKISAYEILNDINEFKKKIEIAIPGTNLTAGETEGDKWMYTSSIPGTELKIVVLEIQYPDEPRTGLSIIVCHI